ncbi:Hypothetical protein BCAN_B0347 [Brucella canis ATCC 23365]|uniref:Uncharacterized protein n=1 Tax=Brucella canis (strain ATCC 23365 / NCTC 10854 / RM-666) TaxID=483179 RepID=A9ME93_BRUC2|nr:Hypothetical protein BCAN_B0347 [Brucella canis ATCC 23365]
MPDRQECRDAPFWARKLFGETIRVYGVLRKLP